jgi:hypothetical protein
MFIKIQLSCNLDILFILWLIDSFQIDMLRLGARLNLIQMNLQILQDFGCCFAPLFLMDLQVIVIRESAGGSEDGRWLCALADLEVEFVQSFAHRSSLFDERARPFFIQIRDGVRLKDRLEVIQCQEEFLGVQLREIDRLLKLVVPL